MCELTREQRANLDRLYAEQARINSESERRTAEIWQRELREIEAILDAAAKRPWWRSLLMRFAVMGVRA